jgi:peptide-methionine (S)-S-oxide reductase
MIGGIESATPGYSGGKIENPTYEQVSAGKTGHAEAVKIEYDPHKISFRELLTIFFATHDPTTLNKQGNDIGTQYRSVIFYTNAEQKQESEKFIEKLNATGEKGNKIVTDVVPFEKFYEAEDYHKNYQKIHKENPYCELVIEPKLEKVQKEFSKLLKNYNLES